MKKLAKYFMLFGGILIMSFSGVLLNQSSLKPQEILMIATMFASLAFCIWHFATKQKFLFIRYTKDLLLTAGAGACFGGFLILFLLAYQTVAKGSLFAILLGIVLLYTLSTVFLKETFSRNSLVSLGLLVLGGGMLLYSTVSSFIKWIGILYVIGAAVCLCCFGILFKMVKKLSISEKSTFGMAFCFLILAVYVGITEGFMIYIPNKDFLWLGIVFVVSVCFGSRILWYGYEVFEAKYAALAAGLVLPIAVLTYIVFEHYALMASDVFGFVFVIAGIVYLTYFKTKENEKPVHVEFKTEDTNITLS